MDDSPLMQAWLKKILSSDPEIGEVTTVQDPYEAKAYLHQKKPDLITLDVEMPGQDGLSFLKEIMTANPLPVIMVSAYTQENCQTTIKALSLGAVDFIPKPGPGSPGEKETFPQRLLVKVKEAVQARTGFQFSSSFQPYDSGRQSAQRLSPKEQKPVVGIGASTGGPQALTFLLSQLPEDMPPLVIVQHMPAQFTSAFADHLDQSSLLTVKEAQEGSRLKSGLAFVAAGGKHCLIKKDSQGYFLTLNENPPVNHHRPSVDVLFQSLAQTFKEKGIGILLTGMGDDGARGLLEMRNQGAQTLAQDASTSTIFGMPQAAIQLGAARDVAPLDKVPAWLIKKVRG